MSPANFIAASNGMITSLNAYIAPGTASIFQMGLYDGVLQQLAVSSPQQVLSPGWQSFPVSSPGIKGRAYQILLTAGTGDYQFGTDTTIPARAVRVANGQGCPYQLAGVTPSSFGAPAFYADGDVQAQVLQTSGTHETFFTTATIISRAFGRCQVASPKISDEMLQIAREELFLILVGLANGPTPLWAIEEDLFPFAAGFNAVRMPWNTVDVKNVNYRQMSLLQGGTSSYAPLTPVAVPTIGVTWSGPAQPFFVLMDGREILSVANPNASAGQVTLYDIDGAVPASQWSVVGQNIGAVSFFSQLYEIPMYGYSRDEWSQLPNRSFPGTPRQFWFERVVPPVLHLWPVPQSADESLACLVTFRHRHIADVGTLAERIECPPRWLPAIIDQLAEALGRYPPVDPQLLPTLATYAAKSLALAKGEERENAPTKFVPQISGYTR